MFEILFVLILALLFIGFAIFGLIRFIMWLVVEPNPRPTKIVYIDKKWDRAITRPLNDDVFGASKLLNFLKQEGRISQKNYDQLRDYLDREFEDCKKADRFVNAPIESEELILAEQIVVVENENQEAGFDDACSEPVTAEVVGLSSNSSNPEIADSEKQSRPAPWDLPDPPTPKPRRTFNEVMSGFMQEKNIRWGELASGILIVGSAVGLVVSLRDELRDTIPYFSSLMFLLITAAIHGGGIYTLKQWKLRNTSRGTLLIGLLLIPLNIVAACILSGSEADRRELTDPLLWLALVIGLSSFGAMAWCSAKCLLRRGQLPLALAILGCCVGTLFINRSNLADGTVIQRLLLSFPIAISFLIGTAAFYKRQWTRKRWNEKSAHRMYVFLGLSAFAAVCASSMLVIRATDKSSSLVTLLPLAMLVSLMSTWLGRITWKGAVGKRKKTIQLTGLSLHVLGLGLIALSLFASASIPTVLFVNTGLAGIGLLLFAWHQKEATLFPPAWAAISAFVFCVVSFTTGGLSWNGWSSLGELQSAALSGQAGLAMVATGVGVVILHSLFAKRSHDAEKLTKVGVLSGVAIFAVGCGLALLASIINRDIAFDVWTATSLLGIGLILLMSVCIFAQLKPRVLDSGKKGIEQCRWLTLLTAAVSLAFLVHGLFWNRDCADWTNQLAFGIDGNWVLIFAIHGLILTSLACVTRFLQNWFVTRTDESSLDNHKSAIGAIDAQSLSPSISTELVEQESETRNFKHGLIAELLGDYSLLSLSVGLVGVLFFLHYQSGFGTVVAAATSIAMLVLVVVQSDYHDGVKTWTNGFTISTGVLVFVAIAELVTRFSWCPGASSVRFWLVQAIGLSAWAGVCVVVAWLLDQKPSLRRFVDYEWRPERIFTHGVVLGITGVIGVSLVGESGVELFKGDGAPLVSLTLDSAWVFAALGSITLTLLLCLLKQPKAISGAALVVVWFLTVGFCSNFFADTKAVATALRWILPIGGAIGAVMVASRRPLRPAWAATRNQLGLRGRSTWSAATTQHLINGALALVAVIVLAISTIAIAQVMMNGGVSALGGPDKGTVFGDMKKDVSYGLPVGIMVGTFLLYAISERRRWLATAGSLVFQYCVLLSVVLLFVSPHEKLATSWFVNILQAVSVGMTGYGFVWLCFRKRIEGAADRPAVESKWASQIEVHTFINGLLITSLAALVVIRFYSFPDQAGGWINSVGGWLGILAWLIFSGLAISVWRKKLAKAHRTSTWMWLVCWLGMILVGMVAALVDRAMLQAENITPWRTFNVVLWGSVLVCVAQVLLLWLEGRPEIVAGWFRGNFFRSRSTRRFQSIRSDQSLPLLAVSVVVMLFATRGMGLNSGWFWGYFAAVVVLVGCITFAGIARQSPWLGGISAGVTTCLSVFLVRIDPEGWFSLSQPYYPNVISLSLSVLALVWCASYVWLTVFKPKRNCQNGTGLTLVAEGSSQPKVRPSMMWMSNLVLLGGTFWILVGSLAQWFIESRGAPARVSVLANPLGIGVMISLFLLLAVSTWSNRRKGWVIACWLWLSGIVTVCLAAYISEDQLRFSLITVSYGAVIAFCGVVWRNRGNLSITAHNCKVPRVLGIERSMSWQFPVLGGLVATVSIVIAFVSSQFSDDRLNRYLIAFAPLLVGLGFALFSGGAKRRVLQLVSLSIITLSAVFLSWADLNPAEFSRRPIRLFVRALLVFSGAMFVYGGLVSRWVDANSRWLKSLKEMSVATCLIALASLAILVLEEFRLFVPDVGCGLPITDAIAVGVVAIGMIVGLIIIAVVPKNDPFSFSLRGRMWYVYAAQLTGAILVVHLYTTMPFLFRIGIKDYWPYIAMLLCFSGVGIAQVLQKRKLIVLAEPIFTTAALLPVLIAVCIWGIDSKADFALVMLTVGMAYLMISYTNQSLVAGCAAILFGNIALWLFYDKFDSFSFLDHPQLWLIPPAISTLVASQIGKSSFTRSQLGLIRYICVSVIYLSSTSEIFISGLGEKLWPPMILALLSVGGILAGMLLQVRAYLYLGLVFLLLSFLTMVSHAHQRFDHVWPWWAFGFTLGISILVMFGLFEKKRKEMKQVIGQLNEWDL